MDANQRERLRHLIQTRAIRKQNVVLASGQPSTYYIDGRMVLMHGEAATLIGDAMFAATRDLGLDAVGGLEVGAVPVATATAIAYHRHGQPMEGFFVRKEAKAHGLQKLIEGRFETGWRVAIVEDVMTTGGSAQKAIQAVRDAGGIVAVVLCLVDRLQGAAEVFASLGVAFRPLFTIRDFDVA
jgi:orotate phosphoribosyltransferase